MKAKTIAMITALTVLSLFASACGGSEAEATPTMDPKAIETFAVATFASGLTQTALAAPTQTPSPTNTSLPLPTIANVTPFGTIPAANPTSSCYAMAFVSDVTIQDNTTMTPGQAFTKTWKVKNTGTCAWDAGFKFSFTSGNAMNGATYTVPQSVPANTDTEISVPMTAPSTSGTARGNWRMSTAAGQFFGDEVYVQIIVSGGAAGTGPTGTVTPTSTPTPTP